MGKGFKELSPNRIKPWPGIFYNGGMRRTLTVLWFATAFVAGAIVFLATRPRPVLNEFVMELTGVGLFERCRQAGACEKPIAPHPPPASRPQSPPDMDRA
jgi:hypothetical protein